MLKQKGQGLLEFALILPPLLMLVLGIIEAARVFHAYLAVQHAAREAARYAITGRPFDEFDPSDGPFQADDPTRAAAIKQIAVSQAVGLTIDYWGLTVADFDANLEAPAFFGVDIHGFDTHDQPEQRDDPGQPGLPVRVRVVYNLVILDPLYRAIVPQIRLVGHVEMVNEGIQVGHGGQPPPTFGPTPTLPAPPKPPTPTPTATPEGEYIALNTYFAVAGQDIDIYLVQHAAGTSYDVYWIAPDLSATLIGTYTTDGDGYVDLPYTVPPLSTSGQYTIESRLGGAFVASVTIEVQGLPATSTHTATPTETGTPTLTPTATSTPEGAYIALGQYYAIPGEQITIELIQHEANTTYDVYWITPDLSQTLIDDVITNASGNAVLFYTVPAGSGEGTYTIQSELDGSFVASVDLNVLTITPTPTLYELPDLIITSIALGSSTAVPGTPVTVTVQIQNNGGATTDLFDIDLYVDPDHAPFSGSPGLRKQWQNGLAGGGATATLVFDVTFYGSEATHRVWGQVDTTNFVDDEANEDNNVYGPVSIAVVPQLDCYLEDDMESGAPGWSAHEEYEDGSGAALFALVEHGSSYYGSSSHSWWIDEVPHHLQSWLDSPVVDVPAGALEPQLIFWHRMISEEDWDGGYLRYSTDGGSSWTTVGNDMIASGGYNSQVHNDWHTLPAWAGNVGPRQVVVNIPAAAIGGSIQFRWQWECDESWTPVNPNGWWIDDVAVCTQTDLVEPPDQPKPPGLKECVQVIENGDFEAGSTPWQFPGTGDPDFGSTVRVGGGWPDDSTFVMRLHANTIGGYVFQPWLYQDLTMPEFVNNTSTATLNLHKKVCEPGHCPDSPNSSDPLYVVLRDPDTGDVLTQDITVATGMESGTYVGWPYDLFNDSTQLGGFDPADYAGKDLRLYFYAPNDGTANAWFYVDTLECEVCTVHPVPSPPTVPDKVTVGGLAQVLLGGVPRNLPGINVYAYTADGELFSTYTIQDSKYYFYWQLPPGETIYIYAETYIGSYRYWTQTEVPAMSVGQQKLNVDLLLLQG